MTGYTIPDELTSSGFVPWRFAPTKEAKFTGHPPRKQCRWPQRPQIINDIQRLQVATSEITTGDVKWATHMTEATTSESEGHHYWHDGLMMGNSGWRLQHSQNYCYSVQWTSSAIAFEMAVLKIGPGLQPLKQLPPSKWLWCVKVAILLQYIFENHKSEWK